MIQKTLASFSQAKNTLEGTIQLSEAEKQKIIEQIGEASGRDVKIKQIAQKIKKEALAQAIKSWNKWYQNLNEHMIAKSQFWSSEHSPVWSRDKLIKDYTNQFMISLSEEIDKWGNEILKNMILREYVKLLDSNIVYHLEAIQADVKNIDIAVKTNFINQFKPSINGINDDFMGFGGIGGGIGIGGALAAALFVFTGVGFIALIVTSVVAAIAGSFGLGMLYQFSKIRQQIEPQECAF
ncbi:MAG: dynamin family protein, partial [Aulosira sp. ZfuVER01]|nr:dynamin family protein [Aulosira sp. ZfuVER01]